MNNLKQSLDQLHELTGFIKTHLYPMVLSEVIKFHAGQKYGELDYVEHHLIPVAAKAKALVLFEAANFDADGSKLTRMYINTVSTLIAHIVELVGLLHDSLEDTDLSPKWISANLGSMILADVQRLKHDVDKSYQGYVDDLMRKPICTVVKLADSTLNYEASMIHNDAQNIARQEKYSNNIVRLQQRLSQTTLWTDFLLNTGDVLQKYVDELVWLCEEMQRGKMKENLIYDMIAHFQINRLEFDVVISNDNKKSTENFKQMQSILEWVWDRARSEVNR